MSHIYYLPMLLLVATGVVFAAAAGSTPGFAAGLVLLTVGSGGISAGLVTRETKSVAGRQLGTSRKA